VDRLPSEGVGSAMVILRQTQAETRTGRSAVPACIDSPREACGPARRWFPVGPSRGSRPLSKQGVIVAPLGARRTRVRFQVKEKGCSRPLHACCGDR
jgi:hypothetical protein